MNVEKGKREQDVVTLRDLNIGDTFRYVDQGDDSIYLKATDEDSSVVVVDLEQNDVWDGDTYNNGPDARVILVETTLKEIE